MASPKNKQNFDKLVAELRTFADLNVAAKDASNALNKQKTVVKKLFKPFLSDESFPAQTTVVVDGIGYKFCVAESERIDPREWYRLWQEKEITDDQYFDAINVGKDAAKTAVGDDQVATISRVLAGKEADVRRVENPEGATGAKVEVIVPGGVKPKVGIRPRLQTPASPNLPTGPRKLTIKPRIRA